MTKVLEAYRRRACSIDQVMMACFVLGMSTGKVSSALLLTLLLSNSLFVSTLVSLKTFSVDLSRQIFLPK